MRLIVLIALLCISAHAAAGLEEAKKALSSGKYSKAVELFTPLADAGDTRAAVTIGTIYYEGQPGVKQDYEQAYSGYEKALNGGDGEAFNNIGVMFRDGKGVPQNREIAYLLFLVVNRNDLGSDSTQIRAFRNLQREMAEQKKEDLEHALCYTAAYLMAYVQARGKLNAVPDDLKASTTLRAFKDAKFWTQTERDQATFTCSDQQ